MTRIIQMTQPGCNAGKQVAGRLNKKIENSIFALIYLHKVQYHNSITNLLPRVSQDLYSTLYLTLKQ